MERWTVSALARLAGVSVRTLHYYDEQGILKPSGYSAAGYRLYENQDLLKLQQVMFLRELDVPLAQIKRWLNSEAYDPKKALEDHKRLLKANANRIFALIKTVDKTIEHLKGVQPMLTDAELYEGFDQKEIEALKAEAQSRWGENYERSSQKVAALSKKEFEELKNESTELWKQANLLKTRAVDDPEVVDYMKRLYANLGRYMDISPDIFQGLGQLYVQDDRFRATFDRFGPGIPEFLNAAMTHFARSQK